MRPLIFLALLTALAACGADGDPEPRKPGLRVSGEVGIGVSGRF